MAGQRQPIALVQAKGKKHLTKAEIAERERTEVKAQHRRNRRAECREAFCPSSFPALQMRLRDAGSGIRRAATQRFSSKSGAM